MCGLRLNTYRKISKLKRKKRMWEEIYIHKHTAWSPDGIVFVYQTLLKCLHIFGKALRACVRANAQILHWQLHHLTLIYVNVYVYIYSKVKTKRISFTISSQSTVLWVFSSISFTHWIYLLLLLWLLLWRCGKWERWQYSSSETRSQLIYEYIYMIYYRD